MQLRTANNRKRSREFKAWYALPDHCDVCQGSKGGQRGNENLINGLRVCDYCHADESYQLISAKQKNKSKNG